MEKLLLAALTLLLFAACSKNNLPDYNKLGDLRILALIADKPEAPPGTVVTITPVISDVNGGGRALTYTAEACNDPGVGAGAVPTCSGSPTRVALATGLAVTGIAAPDFTGAATSTVAVTLPATAFTNSSAIQQAIGVAYLFTYKLTAADGATLTGFKRIIVSTKPVLGANPNQNPSISAILADGAPMVALSSNKVSLSLQLGANAAESYVSIQGDGTTTTQIEELTTTWFVSDGAIDAFRTVGTDPVGFMQPSSPPPNSRHVVILAVTHDGRGGEAFFKVAL